MTPDELEAIKSRWPCAIQNSRSDISLLISEVERAWAEIEQLKISKTLVKKAVDEIEDLEEGINLTAEFMAEHTVFGDGEKKRPASYFRKDMRDNRYTLKLKDRLKDIYFD